MAITTDTPAPPATIDTGRLTAVLLLFFLSGFAGLVYEVLWMKELGLLFGNTTQAAATTLAAFFLGIAAGGYVLGRRAARIKRPLAAYGLLEAAVTLSACLYFFLLDAYHLVYTPLFEWLGPGHPLFVLAKFVLALSVLFPPAFFMGGTLPIMSQYLVRHPEMLGRTASMLYAINTFGASLGAFAAGFFLPRWLGFTGSYLVAIVVTASVATLAVLLSRSDGVRVPQPVTNARAGATAEQDLRGVAVLSAGGIRTLAFLSGFVTLALEVLWTRMFAQVLHNSVYTFATILVIFLVSLAIGAVLARWLVHRRYSTSQVLFLLMTGGALLVGASPLVFGWITDNLAFFGGQQNWFAYTLSVFGAASVVMLLPGILLGTVFPYLMKVAEGLRLSAGQTVGDLAAVNTVGAVAGSLCAGFVLLELIGLWDSIRAIAAVYLLFSLVLLVLPGGLRRVRLVVTVAGLAAVATVLDGNHLPLVTIDPVNKKEEIVQVYQGSSATVAVIHSPGSLRIKVNNYYGLGGTGASAQEERQSHLPLLLHSNPESVFYLGMGTGITAGAALRHPVDKVLVTELIPEVVEASKTHFPEFLNGLFDDPRAHVVAEDGRNYLLGTDERFDLIIADLFVPWKAGTGSLYSREHYEAALARLNSGGIYAQWLPLFQMSQEEFGIIVRTMLEVFPQITLWRGKFHAIKPIVLLAGYARVEPLDFDDINHRLGGIRDWEYRPTVADRFTIYKEPGNPAEFLLHYAGNISAARGLFDRYRVNTDDRPLIEYEAPITHRNKKAGENTAFVREELMIFYDLLLQLVPPDADPYLQQLSARERELVLAGNELYRFKILGTRRDNAGASQAYRNFRKYWHENRY